MARKNLKVSGPSEAPPVAADLTRERPSRSRSVASSSSSAARERRPASSACTPVRTPQSKRRRVSGFASMTRARTSAAICSQTRGASRRWVGPISRRSAIAVSALSGKLTRMRQSSGMATT